MVNVFFSYSHRDEDLRNELEVHLSALKRQGLITTWHDRRIGAGKEVNHSISEHLDQADIILLLVSPYFIASDYCYGVEMKRAIERHEAGAARVIPIILHPCDWHDLPFGKLMATPTDGKPVSKFPNQHDAFLEITTAIKNAVKDMAVMASSDRIKPVINAPESEPSIASTPQLRSSNLRIKKAFTDVEKERFLSEAFEYIAKFFDGSLAELRTRNVGVEGDFRRIDTNHFWSVVYRNGAEMNRCRIWLSDRKTFSGGIAYAVGQTYGDNSYNEVLSVDDDGFILFLKPMGMAFYRDVKSEKMTFEGAAEYYWGIFIEPLQR